ncbi:homoserine O-acetyltransferase/O-succinyltransferase family protein [Dongshaea marina]|uniref:homoserine O-acetyltransferase/O-succinyltransferase family protein n=1 Tax=Dongshaea marina TaxID=2047966 RepID=UPI000D3EA3EB|nr:homoserine O-succinyltransferase [Dongshaea marina]
MAICTPKNYQATQDAGFDSTQFSCERADLRLGIINLMPFKSEVEQQFFSVFSDVPLNIELEFLCPFRRSKHQDWSYIQQNYHPLQAVFERSYDGLIVTGAPVEHLPFEEVDYWPQLRDLILDNSLPTIYICWAAQAALYLRYQIPKYPLPEKLFGVYPHSCEPNPFITGDFRVPHSRFTCNREQDLRTNGLKILACSSRAGVYMAATPEFREFFITGHPEYQRERLQFEYLRDGGALPEHYFPNDDPALSPEMSWLNHRQQFYRNWLNHIRNSL